MRALDAERGAAVRRIDAGDGQLRGNASHHLLVLEEANPANPALCLSLGSACGPFNEQAARTKFGPAFGSVELQRTIANASYNALEATLNYRAHGLDVLGSYTYEVAGPVGGIAGAGEPGEPSLSRGCRPSTCGKFVTSFHYELPGLKRGTAGDRADDGMGRVRDCAVHKRVAGDAAERQRYFPVGDDSERDQQQWRGYAGVERAGARHSYESAGGQVFDAAQLRCLRWNDGERAAEILFRAGDGERGHDRVAGASW